jgi:molybdenum cofactor cytidylyltransferase
MKARPVVIVLAAGQGTRFGGPAHKLGQSLGGSSVLGEVLRHTVASHLPAVVVTTDARKPDARSPHAMC